MKLNHVLKLSPKVIEFEKIVKIKICKLNFFEELGSNAHQENLPELLKCQNWDWSFFQKERTTQHSIKPINLAN